MIRWKTSVVVVKLRNNKIKTRADLNCGNTNCATQFRDCIYNIETIPFFILSFSWEYLNEDKTSYQKKKNTSI